jgi:thymidylate synthase (FAD)
MRIVEPKVHLIAETSLIPQNLEAMLSDIGGDIALEWYRKTRDAVTSPGEYLTEVGGRTCYKAFGVGLNPNVTQIRADSRKYLENLLKEGHGSVLEHSTCTFAFVDVSRVFTHELVRHRVGVAISQESLRYVRPRELRLWIPPDVRDNQPFLNLAEQIETGYKELDRSFDWDNMSFAEKKKLTSALRRVLPDGMATNIIWTANHRTIRHVITMRTSEYAEVEIRTVFDKVAQIVTQRYPSLYQDFERNPPSGGIGSWRPKYLKV